MGSTAFVFPGQGAQYVGMGQALCARFPAARDTFEEANSALGEDLAGLIFEGPEETLRLTANTQPAILTVSVALYRVLALAGHAPEMVAGHSLGEYSALVAAGAMDFSDAVRVVRARGAFMQQAVAPGVGAMAAVMKLAPEAVRACCEEAAQDEVCAPANYNSPEQTVIAGHASAVARAVERLKAAGARRVVTLQVSAPFHCALMGPVSERLAEVLGAVEVRAPRCPVVSNVEASLTSDPARIRQLLLEQVFSPVRWVESVIALREAGMARFIEVGPGRTLAGLIRQIDPGLEVSSADEPEVFAALLRGEGAADV